MTAQLVEYLIRVRFEEPPDDPAIPAENRIGAELHLLLGELEQAAEEVEIVSRRVVGDPDRPRRVRCAAADLWGDRHMATGNWYRVTDPEGRVFDLCSGACLVEYATLGALPADLEAGQAERDRAAA
jgi:hypothetical protein